MPKLGQVVSVYAARMAGREDSGGGGGGVIMIPPRVAIDCGLYVDGKRRLIRGEGFTSRVSGNVRPQDPGGGAMSIVPPRRMTSDDVSNTPELSGGIPVGGCYRCTNVVC